MGCTPSQRDSLLWAKDSDTLPSKRIAASLVLSYENWHLAAARTVLLMKFQVVNFVSVSFDYATIFSKNMSKGRNEMHDAQACGIRVVQFPGGRRSLVCAINVALYDV